MSRKNYSSVEELYGDLDNETILTEDEDFLSDEDLALLHGSKTPPKKKPRRKPAAKKATPKKQPTRRVKTKEK